MVRPEIIAAADDLVCRRRRTGSWTRFVFSRVPHNTERQGSVNADIQRRLLVVETVPRSTEALRHALSRRDITSPSPQASRRRCASSVPVPRRPSSSIFPLARRRRSPSAGGYETRSKHLPLLVLSPGRSVRGKRRRARRRAPTNTSFARSPSTSIWPRARASTIAAMTEEEPVTLLGPDARTPTRAVARAAARSISHRPSSACSSCCSGTRPRDPPDGDLPPRLGIRFGPSSNSLNVYVGYLAGRSKPRVRPRLIHTVRGVGYVLRDR